MYTVFTYTYCGTASSSVKSTERRAGQSAATEARVMTDTADHSYRDSDAVDILRPELASTTLGRGDDDDCRLMEEAGWCVLG